MSNTFNIQRFSRLFRKHTVENYKTYLMYFAVFCGIISLFHLFLFVSGSRPIDHESRAMLFIFSYIFSGSIFTSTVFSEYGHKEKGIAGLMLPASHFEKFMVGWLYSLPIFTLIFITGYYLVDAIAMTLSLPDGQTDFTRLNVFEADTNKYYLVFYVYLLLNAFSLWGAIFFRKLHFIKVACLFFGIVILITFLHHQLMRAIIPEEIGVTPPFLNDLTLTRPFYRVHLGDSEIAFYLQFLLYSLTGLLLVAAFSV